MKRHKLNRIIIALVAVLSVSIAAVWAVVALGKADVELQMKSVDLREFEVNIDTSTISEETIDKLYQYAEALMVQYDTIVLPYKKYTQRFCAEIGWYEWEKVKIEPDLQTITIDIKDPIIVRYDKGSGVDIPVDMSDYIEYLIVMSMLTEKYKDCLIEGGFNTPMEQNFDNAPYVLVCPEYVEAGYDSVHTYYDAWKSENEEFGTVFKVFVSLPIIRNLGSPGSQNLAKNR